MRFDFAPLFTRWRAFFIPEKDKNLLRTTLSAAPGTISPTGIASAEAFGTLKLVATIKPTAIASAEAFGTLTIIKVIKPTGIPSAEAFGTPKLIASIKLTGIASSEAFGTAKLVAKLAGIGGIASGEAFGTLKLRASIKLTGIASAEAFGTLKVGRFIVLTGIASGEVFGTLRVFFPTFFWRLELRNKSFSLVDIFEPDQEASGIRWDYRRIGGCGTMRFKLSRPFDAKGNIDGTYDVQLLLLSRTTGALELWYRGFIQQLAPSLDDPESVDVVCAGYGAQLAFVRLAKTYSAQQTMEAIVTDIVQNFVAPNTKILFDAALITATGISLGVGESLVFDMTADVALKTIATIVGTREWGVGTDRKFFFKAQQSAIKHRFVPGYDVVRFEDFIDYSRIKNKLHLKGGGSPAFTTTRENTGSQADWGRREEIITNAAIRTNPTGDNYLNALLAEKAIPVRRSTLNVGLRRSQLEAVVPVGKIAVTTGVFINKYGSFKYGAASGKKYGGEFGYQLENAAYTLDDNGALVEMDLGQERPSVAERVGLIEFQVDQLEAART